MKNSIGYGIIGCGTIGQVHAEAIASVPGARLAAVTDLSPDASAALGARFGADPAASAEELVNRPDVDCVCVCTPSGLHLDAVRAAAEAGKHVVCEKPLDTAPKRVEEMCRVTREHGVRLFPVLQKRLKPDQLRISAAVRAGLLGRICLAEVRLCWYRAPEYYSAVSWRGSERLDGGVLLNQGIHALDAMLSLMPAPTAVRGLTARTKGITEAEDTCVGAVSFADGSVGSVEVTTAAFPGLFEEVSFYGEKGSVILRNEKLFYSSLPELPVLDPPSLFTDRRDNLVSIDTRLFLKIAAFRKKTSAQPQNRVILVKTLF